MQPLFFCLKHELSGTEHEFFINNFDFCWFNRTFAVCMVLNYIWIAFFLVAFVIAAAKLLFLGDFDVFPAMMDSTFSSSKTAFEISLGLTGVLSLWLGVMKVGEKGGVVNVLARVLSPIFTKLFPDIPKGHPVTGSIFMNIAANMLGLDNAATPLGLKAMEQMEEIKNEQLKIKNDVVDLQGRQLPNKPAQGLYIENGQKRVIR